MPPSTIQAAPERSMEQMLSALERANEIRSYRARIKRKLAAGELRFDELLVADDPLLATMKVGDLMISVPGVGSVRTTKYLKRCGVASVKTIAGLSQRQRKALVCLFAEGVPYCSHSSVMGVRTCKSCSGMGSHLRDGLLLECLFCEGTGRDDSL